MKSKCTFLLGGLILATMPLALAQTGDLAFAKNCRSRQRILNSKQWQRHSTPLHRGAWAGVETQGAIG